MPSPGLPVAENWYGQYFSNPDLAGDPSFVRDDREVSFDWRDVGPGNKVDPQSFSARWTRSVYFPAGVYRFFATADDGVRLWVDDSLIVDQWHQASSTIYVGDTYLWEGQHDVRIEYYEKSGNARIRVWWERQEVYPDWKAEYFNVSFASGKPDFVRNDSQIRFSWANEAPAPGIQPDSFAVRWTRRVRFSQGMYRFYVRADNGMRVWLDSSLVIDFWDSPGSGLRTVDLSLSEGEYSVKVEYYNNGGSGLAELRWDHLATTPAPAPTAPPAGLQMAVVPSNPAVIPAPQQVPPSTATNQVQALSVPGKPAFALLPSQAAPGATITVRGTGWPAGQELLVAAVPSNVTLPLHDQTEQVLVRAQTDEKGAFEAKFTLIDPGKSSSPQKLQVAIHTADWSTWKADAVRIVPAVPTAVPAAVPTVRPQIVQRAAIKPLLQISPSDVTLGGVMTISGQSWKPGDDVIISLLKPGDDLESAPPFSRAQVDDQGGFAVKVDLPNDPQWTQYSELIVLAHSVDWTTRLVTPLRLVLSTPGAPTAKP